MTGLGTPATRTYRPVSGVLGKNVGASWSLCPVCLWKPWCCRLWSSTRSRTVVTMLSCEMTQLALTCCVCAWVGISCSGSSRSFMGSAAPVQWVAPAPLWASWMCHPGVPGLVTSVVLPAWSGQPSVWGHCDQKPTALKGEAFNFVGIIRGNRLISSNLPFYICVTSPTVCLCTLLAQWLFTLAALNAF